MSQDTRETLRHDQMPVLFVGHGSPMNAIEENRWSRGFKDLRTYLPRPKIILSISAHWFITGTSLTGNERPETIHDFGGFPSELYRMQYPAPGGPTFALRVADLLRDFGASVRDDWGIDHGTWSVLHHVFPEAECPVVQLSIDQRLAPVDHLRLGRILRPLRDEGVLIMGTGNIVHNLRHAMLAMQKGEAATPDWAESFDRHVSRAVEQRTSESLVEELSSPAGAMSHPTLDHYLPLLYAAGAADEHDEVQFPITGFDLSSISMRSIVWG